MIEHFDFAVVGAGVFGAWSAQFLRHHGRVVLVDAYGPANSRASSGGESRIIRTGYGADELYPRWAAESLGLWREFFDRARKPFFQPTGFLWLVTGNDDYTLKSRTTLPALGISVEQLAGDEFHRRFPQFEAEDIAWALFEPNSGVLMARQAVQALVEELIHAGVRYVSGAVRPPSGKGRLAVVHTETGRQIEAGHFVFTCGPWLPKLFPHFLADRFFITRQEVFFYGVPAGNLQFSPPQMPAWVCIGDGAYGIPDLENRGFKFSFDRHGAEFDVDSGSRIVTPEGSKAAHDYLARRFPALNNAPVVETRVCQYENTSNGDFLIDRHPEFENVWMAGGGSGHGLKHGPMLGKYVADLVVNGGPREPRFGLDTKTEIQKRVIF